jgi:hypothetical protein
MAKLSCRPSVTSKGSPAILHLLASLRHLFIIISLILLSGILLSGDKAELKPKNYPLGIINPNKGIEDMHLGFIEGLAQYGFAEGESINGIKIRGRVSKAPDWLLKFSRKSKLSWGRLRLTLRPKLSLEDLRQAEELKGIHLIIYELSNQEDMPKAFVENQQKVDTVFMVHPIFIIKRLIRHD